MSGQLHHGLELMRCARSVAPVLAFVLGILAVGVKAEDVQSGSARTKPASVEMRKHYKVISPSGIDDYVVTEISSNSEKLDRVRTIAEDAQGTRFLLTYETDYVKQVTFHEIRQIGGQEFLRLQFWSPWTATTRAGTIEEAHKHPELLQRNDLRFEFTTAGNGVLAGGNFGLWYDVQSQREWRTRLRSMISAQFLEQLEIMWANGFLTSAVGNRFAEPVRYVVYRPDCPSAELRIEPAAPDCAFDKKLGFPCSDDQKARAEKALAVKPPSTTFY